MTKHVMKKVHQTGLKAFNLLLRELKVPPERLSAQKLNKWSKKDSPPNLDQASQEHILIWSIRDWSVHVQFEAILGQALRAKGVKVSFATCGGGLDICDRVNTWEGPPMPCRSCTKYVQNSLANHGFSPDLLQDDWHDATWPEIDGLSMDELQDVEWEGLPLGRLVQIPVKWFLMAETLSMDPLGPATMRSFLRSARKIAEAAGKILERNQPDQVVILNGLMLFESIIAELCRQRSISFITYERALMLDTFVLERDNIASYYRVDREWEQWKDVALNDSDRRELLAHFSDRQTGSGVSDNYWDIISPIDGYRSATRVRAVLFTNLVWDTAVLGQDIAFSSIMDWITASIHAFENRSDAELIIRIHPAEIRLSGRESRERLGEAITGCFPTLPENIKIIPAESRASSYDLIQQADFALVYTSTIGLEALLQGIPVIVSGQTHYRGKGFSIDVSSAQEFHEAVELQCSEETRSLPNIELVERYAHLLFFKSAYRNLGLTEPVRGLCKVDVESIKRSIHRSEGDLNRITTTILEGSEFRALPPSTKI